jgi:RNA polymerase subunit RPABC4/transcription elongation factor Spt4
MGEMRFYCRECNRILDRRKVIPVPYEERYRCKWCGTVVMSTKKLLAMILGDYVEYLESKGEDLSKYE